MGTAIDQTPVMGEPEREQARRLTLARLRPPRRIAGYEQERFLGRGAFGEVWVAVDSNSGRKVAIKYYHRRGGLDWSLLSREVEKLRYLFGDRHVVQLLAVGWEGDPPYYVMEYMESGSLEDLLRAGTLPAERTVELIRGIATGLIHAHGKGVLHCDLKPGNVMLDQDGNPRLADFGQSRLSHEHAPALGTLFYMAPEQADLTAVPDARWDVYALGAVAYRMLVGNPPYRTPEALAAIQRPGPLEERLARYRALIAAAPLPAAHRAAPGVDAELARVIEKCLAVRPHDRYPNAQAVLAALDARAYHRARRPLLLLGGLAPVLAALVILGAAAIQMAGLIKTTEHEEIERAREVNRLAARSEADRLGWEVAARWQVLQQEAADPRLRASLIGGNQPADAALAAWLIERQDAWGDRGGPGLRGTNWVVLDRAGYLRACTEPDPYRPGRSRLLGSVTGKFYGFRDYFHGRGRDLPQSDGPPAADPPTPVTRPHRSAAFRQIPQYTFAVAYSVPIPGPDPADPTPVGALVLISDLVGPTRLEGGDGRNRFVVLVDTGPYEDGQPGLIIRHPYQEAYRDHPQDLPLVFAPELAEKRGGYDGPYDDPVGAQTWGSEFAKPWLAAVEPVRVPIAPAAGPGAEADAGGWVVVVQEAKDEVVGPVQTLRGGLVVKAAAAILLAGLLVGALWGFVMVVMNAAPDSRVVRFLRRQVGLPSGGSAGSASAGSSDAAAPSPLPARGPGGTIRTTR